jgi:hypothetical protein
MVHLERGGDLREIKGTLRLEEEALVFEARGTGERTSFPLGSVRRAKRTFGSPVMVVRWMNDGARRETAFYFAQPPPLPGARADVPSSAEDLLRTRRPGLIASARQSSRRRQRRQAIGYMTTHAGASKESIGAWVRAISERAGG